MKSVIIYTYYMSKSSNYNFSFFVKNEISFKPNIDYIVIINGYNYDTSIEIPILKNLILIRRDNIGYDFGGHYCALQYIKKHNKKYDYFFFLNSGVIGPILHYNDINKNHWTKIFIDKINDKVKLIGTTIVCLQINDLGGYGPKVEGFFFMTDKIGLQILENEKTIFRNHYDKTAAIIDGEYGLSNCMFKNKYTIDCMLDKYKKIDWKDKKNYTLNDNKHPSRKNSYFGESINPFEVIFHKWFWHNEEDVNFDIIKKYVDDKNKKFLFL